MTGASDPLQRRKQQAIISAYGISLVCGAWIAMLFPGLTNPDTLGNARGPMEIHGPSGVAG